MSYPRFSSGSPVIRLNATTRLLHIPIIASFSLESPDGSRGIEAFDLGFALGHFLALKHFNDRSPLILPGQPSVLQGCDIQLTTEIYDLQYDIMLVSRIVSTLLQREKNTLESPLPAAMVGVAFSSEAKPVAILNGIYGVPFITGSATSSELENRGSYPTFARVIPTDAATSFILLEHFQEISVHHFAVIYPNNEFGINFARDFRTNAAPYDIKVASFAFEITEKGAIAGSIQAAVTELKNTGYNYFVGIPIIQGDDEQILRQAYRAGITGPGFVWFINNSFLLESEFDYDDREIIDAMNGIGLLNLEPEVPASFEESLLQFQFDSSLQDEFVASLVNVDDQLFVDFDLTKEEPVYSFWAALGYDAVLLPAYAACSISEDFFSRERLVDAISNASFQGSTGQIRLSSDTQTREPGSIQYAFENLVIDENASTDGKVRFRNIEYQINLDEDRNVDLITFIYSDNSTNPPISLPTSELNMNLISDASRITGLVLCGIVVCIALGWIAFAYLHRKAKYIRGSQPPFLYMLCVGVILMASSIIPTSLQEPLPTAALNVACMSQLWLMSIGFTTTFSALFCKIWRLNKILNSAKRCKRVRVRTKDVLYPFVILLSVNILLLAVWSVVDPLLWVRTEDDSSIDHGVPTGSTAHCSSTSQENEIIFYTFFSVLNFVALGCANWQSFRGRKMHSEFSESANIAMSMMLMTEALLLGLPVLFLVAGDPSAFFVVRSVLIAAVCLMVMMPIFVPKVSLRNKREIENTRVMRTRSSIRGSWFSNEEDSSDSENGVKIRQEVFSSVQNFVTKFSLPGSNSSLPNEIELTMPSGPGRRNSGVVFQDSGAQMGGGWGVNHDRTPRRARCVAWGMLLRKETVDS